MDAQQVTQRKQQILQEIARQEALLNAYALVEADLKGSLEPATETKPQPKVVVQPAAKAAPAEDDAGDTSENKGGSGKVRAILPFMPERFSIDDVEARLNELGTPLGRNTISFVLSRFQKRKEIVQLEKGVGKRPGVFGMPGKTTSY